MAGDSFLHRYFLNNSDKTLHKWVHYFDIYERHFERFRGKSPVMVEIGVFKGGSVQMWREYFGPGSRIVGVDIDPACGAFEAEGIEIVIGDQSDPDLLAQIVGRLDRIDVVLDDGSHISRHMIATFAELYEKLAPNGVYMVEDTHACYWPGHYEGGLRKVDTFMEFAKAKVDELNAVHTHGSLTPSPFTASTDSITFYDSVVVFERRPQAFRQAPMTSGMNHPR